MYNRRHKRINILILFAIMSNSEMELVYRGGMAVQNEEMQVIWTRAREKMATWVKAAAFGHVTLSEIFGEENKSERWREVVYKQLGETIRLSLFLSFSSAVFLFYAMLTWIQALPSFALVGVPIFILVVAYFMRATFRIQRPVSLPFILSIVFLFILHATLLILLIITLKIGWQANTTIFKMETTAKLELIYHWVHLVLFSGTCLLVPVIYLLMDVLLLIQSIIYSKITDRNVAKLREKAKMEDIARTAAKEALAVIDTALQASLSWARTRCETLRNLLVADNAPEVRKKVTPVFAKVLTAVKVWEKAKSMCQFVVNMKDESKVAKEAEGILEAVTAAEAISREAEEMFCQAIPIHNDSKEKKKTL
jgi:hypothetical protein